MCGGSVGARVCIRFLSIDRLSGFVCKLQILFSGMSVSSFFILVFGVGKTVRKRTGQKRLSAAFW